MKKFHEGWHDHYEDDPHMFALCWDCGTSSEKRHGVKLTWSDPHEVDDRGVTHCCGCGLPFDLDDNEDWALWGDCLHTEAREYYESLLGHSYACRNPMQDQPAWPDATLYYLPHETDYAQPLLEREEAWEHDSRS